MNGHREDIFVHNSKDKGCRTPVCGCGHTMAPVFSLAKPLLYFEEGRARTIYNLGDKPVTVRSHKEHREAMKRAGVSEAGQKRGAKGSWI